MQADMRTDTRRSARGFTLIEILMAMMVLSIGLASVLSVFIVGLRTSRRVVDESAAAVAAKAMLARVLSEDVMPAGVGGSASGDGVRDFLELIAVARGNGSPQCDWVWIHDRNAVFSGKVGGGEADIDIPDPTPIALDSDFGWRCRASRYRGKPGEPRKDLEDPHNGGMYVPLTTGRVPMSQINNPDSDEMWRLTIEIYRDYMAGQSPLSTFETYACMAHR
jgi:prepilin-type N-terminal cleavage/methylation domain-containing protein